MLVSVPDGIRPSSTCPACARGCGCPLDGPGCEHYGCYGRHRTLSCPGVPVEEARYAAACALIRAEHARTLARRARMAELFRAAHGILS